LTTPSLSRPGRTPDTHRGSKLAINPPDSVDPRGETASIAIADGTLVAGDAPPGLLEQARRFITANRDALIDYWEYRIDTETLRQRLKSI
jgi:hypothetical protein